MGSNGTGTLGHMLNTAELDSLLESIPQVGPELLWANVLLMGVRDAVMGPRSIRSKARGWLFSNDHEDGVGSVLWICSRIKFTKLERVRKEVRVWMENTPRRKFRTV